MSKLRVDSFSISLDGYACGPDQSLESPLGVGGETLHEWFLPTETFRTQVLGLSDGETGVDNSIAQQGFANVGAWIMGRNMFCPLRGPWLDDSWRGWWGENPVYHMPVFVLTHHPRKSLVMEGGTTFHFITDGIERALTPAREAANGKDVRLGGGATTIRQYLQAQLIDALHIAQSPVLLGRGEPLFKGLDLPALGYTCTKHLATPKATHFFLSRTR